VIHERIGVLRAQSEAIAKSAGEGESNMLRLIGDAHGVMIPTHTQILTEGEDMFFVWNEEAKTESATKKRRASTKEKRAAKATEKAAAKKKA